MGIYIWGGLLTERLESKQRKLAKQIETILRITNPQRHIHTNNGYVFERVYVV